MASKFGRCCSLKSITAYLRFAKERTLTLDNRTTVNVLWTDETMELITNGPVNICSATYGAVHNNTVELRKHRDAAPLPPRPPTARRRQGEKWIPEIGITITGQCRAALFMFKTKTFTVRVSLDLKTLRASILWRSVHIFFAENQVKASHSFSHSGYQYRFLGWCFFFVFTEYFTLCFACTGYLIVGEKPMSQGNRGAGHTVPCLDLNGEHPCYMVCVFLFRLN